MIAPLELTDLVQTCSACPSQWEGRTADGQVLYVRYRFGWLYAAVGPTLDDAVDTMFAKEMRVATEGRELAHRQLDMGGWDGCMTTEDMLAELSDVLRYEEGT